MKTFGGAYNLKKREKENTWIDESTDDIQNMFYF